MNMDISPQEPNLKRPRMSATTYDDEDRYENTVAVPAGDGENLTKRPRFKRRKIAIFRLLRSGLPGDAEKSRSENQ